MRLQGSSLEDWPISYDDLEPFYDKAEYEIGFQRRLLGHALSCARAAARCPCRRCRRIANSRFWSRRQNGWGCIRFTCRWRETRVPYNGRGPCMRCRWCCGFACEVDAKNGSQNTVIPVALATGNCELRSECMVMQVLTDDRGRARGVLYVDRNGNLQEQPGGHRDRVGVRD